MKIDKNIEEWIPINVIGGECSLSSIEYNSTDLSVELYSIARGKAIKILFKDIFSYRVTLEHFRWFEFSYAPRIFATFVRVDNSKYIKWLEDAGEKQLYGQSLTVVHYMLRTTEHVIDVALLDNSDVLIDGKSIYKNNPVL